VFFLASSEKVGFLVPKKRTLCGGTEGFALCFRETQLLVVHSVALVDLLHRVSYLKPGLRVAQELQQEPSSTRI
jgi:hypothetical protein